MNLRLTLMMFLLTMQSTGQTSFHKTIFAGTRNASFVLLPSSAQGYMLIGNGDIASGNLFMLQTDSLGNKIRMKDEIGANCKLHSFGAAQTGEGGYVVTGTEENGIDAFVLKTDSTGTPAWLKTIATDPLTETSFNSIQGTPDKGYVLGGIRMTGGGNVRDAWFTKLDSTGSVIWSRKTDQSSYDVTLDIKNESGGGYIATGEMSSNVFLTKMDGAGQTIWLKLYDSLAQSQGRSLLQLPDGSILICGERNSHVMLMKTDNNGNPIWAKIYSAGTGHDLKRTSDNGFIMVTSDVDGDVRLLKTDSIGTLIWGHSFGGAAIDKGQVVLQASDGGFAIGGSTQPNSESEYCFLIKTDSSGNSVSCMHFPAVLESGYVPVPYTPAFADSFLNDTSMVRSIIDSNLNLSLSDTCLPQITAVENLTDQSEVQLFPNPFSDRVLIDYPGRAAARLIISDLSGKNIFEIKIRDRRTELNLGTLPSGIYLYKIDDGNGFSQRGRLLKN